MTAWTRFIILFLLPRWNAKKSCVVNRVEIDPNTRQVLALSPEVVNYNSSLPLHLMVILFSHTAGINLSVKEHAHNSINTLLCVNSLNFCPHRALSKIRKRFRFCVGWSQQDVVALSLYGFFRQICLFRETCGSFVRDVVLSLEMWFFRQIFFSRETCGFFVRDVVLSLDLFLP